MIKISVMTKCVESKYIETYYDYDIYRQVDKKLDENFEPFGHGKVFYAVIFGDDLLDSFKTLAEAKKFIKKLL